MISRRIVIIIALLAGARSTHAQVPQYCGITYQFDASGNRIKRYWYCSDGHVDVVRSMQHAHLHLQPVPSDQMTMASLDTILNAAAYRLEVMDPTGHLVYEGPFNSSGTPVETAKLANGPYYLRVRNGNEMIIETFIVQH